MNAAQAQALGELFGAQPVASLARFPQSAEFCGFADFSLFAILPRSIRFAGGFAQARTIAPEALADVLGRA